MNDPHARAFVLWFEPGTDRIPERFQGRAEHVISGKVARFGSGEQLLANLRRMLAEERAAEEKTSG